MIFEADRVLELLRLWKISKDEKYLNEIILESEQLIEVLVSRFPREYADDLKQISRIKVVHALPSYDPNVGNIHKYLTSVILNACNSWLRKESRHYGQIPLDEVFGVGEKPRIIANDHLTNLTIHNRERFPSVPADAIDAISRSVYTALIEGKFGKSRGTVTALTDRYDLSRSEATVIYHSSLFYLRRVLFHKAEEPDCEDSEFTLLPELKEFLGNEAYSAFVVLFSGMYVKVP